MKRVTTIRVAAEGRCLGIYESDGKKGVSSLAKVATLPISGIMREGTNHQGTMDFHTDNLTVGNTAMQVNPEVIDKLEHGSKPLSVNNNGVDITSSHPGKVREDHLKDGASQDKPRSGNIPVENRDIKLNFSSQTKGTSEQGMQVQSKVSSAAQTSANQTRDVATFTTSCETDLPKYKVISEQYDPGTFPGEPKLAKKAQNDTSETDVESTKSRVANKNKQQKSQDTRGDAPCVEQYSVSPRKRQGGTPARLEDDNKKNQGKPASQMKEFRRSKVKEVQDKINIIQAVTVRCLLAISSLLSVWRAADVRKDDIYWLLGLTNVVLAIETILVVKFRRGKETIWACPCFLIYLAGTVPSMWFLQLDKNERYNISSRVQTNVSAEALSAIQGITLPFALEPDTWVSVLQQSLLFILVIGRMILPRGDLSREQLSQLLFVYIGSGSDVVEFLVVFDEPEFRSNSTLLYATLIIWSFSLIQFTLVITSSKNPKKTRFGFLVETPGKGGQPLFGIEIISLWVSIIFMDGPYLSLRLYAMIEVGVLSYGIIFFACKNILMLVLLFYRMSIICVKMNAREKRREKNALLELNGAHNLKL